MSKELESKLAAALRPVEPPEEFSRQLLTNVIAQQMPAEEASRPFMNRRRPLAWWLTSALAACLILALGVQQHVEEQRLRQNGLEARREVVEALRMTSQKLNLAYEAFKSQSTTQANEKSGV